MPAIRLAGHHSLLLHRLPIAGACLGVALLAAYRLSEMGSLPTGADGGNWLAIGRAFPGGEGLPNGGAYPPLVPLAARAFSMVMAPEDAIRLLAIASLVAVVAAVLIAGWAETGSWPAMLAAAMVALGRPINEPLAFGGYPQNFALAGSLLSLWLLASAAAQPRKGTILLATAAMAGVALSHHMYFLFTAVSAGLALVIAAGTGGWWRQPLARQRAWLLLPLVAGAVAFAPSLIALERAGYEPALNVSDTTLAGAVRYSFRGALWPWAAVWAVALAAPALAGRLGAAPAASPLRLATLAMLLTATAGFLLTTEARLLPAVAVAAPLSCAAWLSSVSAMRRSTALSAFLAAAPLSLLLATVPSQVAVTRQDFSYYRILDQGFLAAATWAEDHPPKGLTAVRADARNWPVGWWWRGLTTSRVVVGSNPKWLSFGAEREQAETVRAIFAQQNGHEAVALAREHGVARLVAPAPDWIGWQQWLAGDDPELSIVYQNDSMVILDIRAEP